ncbi:MAG: hypothetical protein HY288_06010, partial [Planctomycetia bacterium]|nr:hypothetical protein [Planctomycetia bacterium]
MPGPTDDVDISTATGAVIHASGNDSIKSLHSLDPFTLSGGTLAVSGTVQVDNAFLLSGGTLAGADVVPGIGGQGITATPAGGTLDGVKMDSDLDLSETDLATVNILHGLVLNGTAHVGSADGSRSGRMFFGDGNSAASQNLSGTGTVLFGGSTNNFLEDFILDPGALTIAAGVTIDGENGELARLSSNGTITNRGTITADTAGGTIVADNITNQGTMNATGGGKLAFTGTWTNANTITATNATLQLGAAGSGAVWTNTGLITATNSTINLGGTFTASGLGSFTRSGGTVNLTGTLDDSGPEFTTLDDPFGVDGTYASDISGSNIVGFYRDSSFNPHGFLYDGTTYTTLDDPLGTHPFAGAGTRPGGIDGGNVVGTYVDASGQNQGFLFNGSTWTTLSDPLAAHPFNDSGTNAIGIDGSNIVGFYQDATGKANGFVYDGSIFTTLNDPLGVNGTVLNAIEGNNIVGRYNDSSTSHGFFYNGTSFATIDYPGSVSTSATGISGSNVVGYYQDGLGNQHGFLYNGTTFTTLDDPSAVQPNGTGPGGISGGRIVGEYVDSIAHGFLFDSKTLNLDATTGSWNIQGGTIKGGTVNESGGAKLVATAAGGTLDGVPVNGDLDLSNGTLMIRNNLVLNGTAFIGSADGTTAGTLILGDGVTPVDQDLSGAANLLFGGSASNLVTSNSALPRAYHIAPGVLIHGHNGTMFGTIFSDGTISADAAGGTLIVNAVTSGGTMSASAGGTLRFLGGWFNLNSITANGGTLDLGVADTSPWSNSGTITATNSTVNLGGLFTVSSIDVGHFSRTSSTVNLTGTLDNTGTTLDLNATTGSWNIQGGTIKSGTVNESGGAGLIATSGGGILDGVTVNGDLDLSQFPPVNAARLQILSGLVLNGTAILGTSDGTNLGVLFIGNGSTASQTLSGAATVFLGNGDLSSQILAPGTLTIAPGVTIRGNNDNVVTASASITGEGIINQGTIVADPAGGQLFIGDQFLGSTGFVRFDGMGQLSEAPTATLDFNSNVLGNTQNATGFNPQGTVNLLGSGTPANPQLLEVMSGDKGAVPAGFSQNFNYGTLTVGSSNYVKLVDQDHNSASPPGNAEALYVNLLTVPSGSTLDLNGMHVYAHSVSLAGSVINGTVTASGGTLNLNGDGTAITLNFGAQTVTGGGLGTVAFTGGEVVNLNAGAGAITVIGTAGPDAFDVTPTSTTQATVRVAGVNQVVNTTNTSTLTVDPAGDVDTVTVNGTSANDAITVAHSGASSTAQVNGLKTVTLPTANTEALIVAGGLGNDGLTIDSSSGPVLIPVTYDGGSGGDSLTLSGGTATTDTYTVGPQPGSGVSSIVLTNGGGGTQTVNFVNLEPVLDLVPATTATVNATNADNAINYSQGSVATNGLVSIDNQETYEFSNKDNLVINALAGNDTINLNNPSRPTGATAGGLKNITVNGGDPTASDTLIVNGLVGVLDNLRHIPTGQGAGNVVNDSAAQPQVKFTGVEHLSVVVQQADGDGVRLDGTTGNDRVEFFHGPTGDSGIFRGTMDENNATGGGPFTLTETSCTGLDWAANDADVNFFNPGGTDTFVFNGTAANDTIRVGPGEGGGTEFKNTITGAVISRIEVFNLASALVRGLAGDDTFNHINGVTVPVTYEGGDPTANDTVNLTGNFNNDSTISVTGGTLNLGDSSNPWSNTGTITATDAIVNLGGSFTTASIDDIHFGRSNSAINLIGTLDNTGSTLLLDASLGPATLQGGTIKNGTVIAINGAVKVLSGTLDGGTVNGDLDLTNGTLTIRHNLTLNGTAFVGSADGSTAGSLVFGDGATADSQILSGTGTVLFGGSSDNSLESDIQDPGTLTIASAVKIDGKSGSLFSQFGQVTFVNQGTISADAAGGTISAFRIDNQGTIEAVAGGALDISFINNEGTINAAADGTITSAEIANFPTGTLEATAGGTLSVADGNFASGTLIASGGGTLNLTGNWTNASTITANNGTLNLGDPSNSWINTGTITATNSTVNLGGSFTTSSVDDTHFGRSASAVNLVGVLDNTGGTLLLDASLGPATLQGGQIHNGTVIAINGPANIASGALDAVTANGDFNVDGTLIVGDSLELNGTAFIGKADGSTSGQVVFDIGISGANQNTLSGAANVRFGSDAGNGFQVFGTLTISPGVLIHGQNGSLDTGDLSTIVNQGTISADTPGGTILVGNIDNQGTLQATAGSLGLGDLGLTGGGLFVFEGSAQFSELPSATITVIGDLLGSNTNATGFNPRGTVELNGSGTSASPQLLEAMSADLGSVPAGFTQNFDYGKLILGDSNFVQLVDQDHNSSTPTSAGEAVYVDSLTVPAGTTLDLNGLHLYAHTAQLAGTVINGTVSVTQPPTISISDALLSEGDSATTDFVFTVTLSQASAQQVTVGFATSDGTATVADNDYVATSGTVTFAPGVTSQIVTVPVVGDTLNEPDESFEVNLSNPTGATLAQTIGAGTILNDDASQSVISINDTVGLAGFTAVLTVTATGTSQQPITVAYATQDGSATIANNDYVPQSGILTLVAGVPRHITIALNPGAANEPSESFTVNLSSPSGATLGDAEGTVIIFPRHTSALLPGFNDNTLAANDDRSTEQVNLPFPINFFGTRFDHLWVNNNGNVTFNGPLSTFTPFGLTSNIGTPIIAAFFADVDTRGSDSGLVTYGTGT